MKKLTAGIFATILGLTAIDAYAAQVASTNYVQGAIDSLATVAKTGAYGDLTGTPSIPSIEGLATETYVDQAESDAVATAKTYTDAEIGEIGDMTVKAYVDNAQATATYDDTALKARVTTAEGKITAAEGKITTIEGQQTTQDQKIEALENAGYITNNALTGYAKETYVDQAESDAVATAKAYTDAEIGEIGDMTVKAYVDNAQATATYDDTALKARVTTAEGKITTIEGQQTTQDAAIAAAQKDATQALEDVAAENQVNEAQQQVINALDVTYVKVTDVVDTYPASTPTAE